MAVQEKTAVNPNKALWEKGDFTRIAESMRTSGESLVEGLGISAGKKVLDLGCGDGTTALPAARLGADVLGVDIASNLVEAGNRRAEREGLANLRFEEGDASDLNGLSDNRFDFVVSIFGAMFAPSPFDVAKEMVRVTRSGGTIVMGNWIPNDPTLVAQILRISSAYSPPAPEGFISPMTWGRRQRDRAIRERRCTRRPSLVQEGYVSVQVPDPAIVASRGLQDVLRPNHERIRGRRGRRPRSRSTGRAGGSLQRTECEREPGHHFYHGDVPARHGLRPVGSASDTRVDVGLTDQSDGASDSPSASATASSSVSRLPRSHASAMVVSSHVSRISARVASFLSSW
jgi:SAM-dependent methyltransferase